MRLLAYAACYGLLSTGGGTGKDRIGSRRDTRWAPDVTRGLGLVPGQDLLRGLVTAAPERPWQEIGAVRLLGLVLGIGLLVAAIRRLFGRR